MACEAFKSPQVASNLPDSQFASIVMTVFPRNISLKHDMIKFRGLVSEGPSENVDAVALEKFTTVTEPWTAARPNRRTQIATSGTAGPIFCYMPRYTPSNNFLLQHNILGGVFIPFIYCIAKKEATAQHRLTIRKATRHASSKGALPTLHSQHYTRSSTISLA